MATSGKISAGRTMIQISASRSRIQSTTGTKNEIGASTASNAVMGERTKNLPGTGAVLLRSATAVISGTVFPSMAPPAPEGLCERDQVLHC
ncbi:unnamed protein product [Caretta caretta]